MTTPLSVRRLVAVSAAIAIGGLVAAAPAAAHVRVDEGQAPPQGGYGIVRLIVPTESDAASTVGLTVSLPKGVDILTARTQPIAGWTATVETEPAGDSQRVAKITWRATSAATGIKPTEFGEFTFSAGPWPKDSETVALLTDQSYSDGSVVSWNETAVDANTEPEHPAPIVALGAPEEGHGHGDGHGAEAADPGAPLSAQGHVEHASAEGPHGAATGSETWLWRTTSAVSLVIALATAGLLVVVLRRGRGAGSS